MQAFQSMAINRELLIITTHKPGDPEGESHKVGSNRMIIAIRRTNIEGKKFEERVVLRSKSLPHALLAAVNICDSALRHGSLSEEGAVREWSTGWLEDLETSERENLADNWIAVYAEGHVLYSCKPADVLDEVEAHAHGRALTPEVLSEVGTKMSGPERRVTIEHDEQLAFTLGDTDRGVKVAILDRLMGKTGALRFTMAYSDDKREQMRDKIVGLRCAWLISYGAQLANEFQRMADRADKMSTRELHDAKRRVIELQKTVRDIQTKIDTIDRQRDLEITPRKPNFPARMTGVPKLDPAA